MGGKDLEAFSLKATNDQSQDLGFVIYHQGDRDSQVVSHTTSYDGLGTEKTVPKIVSL